MSYELLIFDADETLFDFKKAQKVAFRQSVDHHQLADRYSELEEVYGEINKKIWAEFERGLIEVDKLKVERFQRLFEACGVAVDAFDFADTYMERLSFASYVYEGVEPLLEKLSAKYRMAIITNGLSLVQNRRIRQSSIQAYFDEIVISEEVALVKPDPKIFDYTLNKLGHQDRSTVLMIGDSLSSDILGASRAGIDACWLNPGQSKNTTSADVKFELKSIMDLLHIL